jgi:hypothetical protein
LHHVALCLQIRMDLKHLKTKRQKAQQKHKNESEQLAVSSSLLALPLAGSHLITASACSQAPASMVD